MRTTIEYILIGMFVVLLWYLLVPKRQCFTVILKNGTSCEGRVRYQGRANEEALKAEIIERMMLDYNVRESDIARIYLG